MYLLESLQPARNLLLTPCFKEGKRRRGGVTCSKSRSDRDKGRGHLEAQAGSSLICSEAKDAPAGGEAQAKRPSGSVCMEGAACAQAFRGAGRLAGFRGALIGQEKSLQLLGCSTSAHWGLKASHGVVPLLPPRAVPSGCAACV